MSICEVRTDQGNYGTDKHNMDCRPCQEELAQSYEGDLPLGVVREVAYEKCLEADKWLNEEIKQGNTVTRDQAIERVKEPYEAVVKKEEKKWAEDKLKIKAFFSGIVDSGKHLGGGLKLFFTEDTMDTIGITTDFWSQLYHHDISPWLDNLGDGAALMVQEESKNFDDFIDRQVERLLGNEKEFIVAPPPLQPIRDKIMNYVEQPDDTSNFA